MGSSRINFAEFFLSIFNFTALFLQHGCKCKFKPCLLKFLLYYCLPRKKKKKKKKQNKIIFNSNFSRNMDLKTSVKMKYKRKI